MTRRDYEELAAAIRCAWDSAGIVWPGETSRIPRAGIYWAAVKIGALLEDRSAGFDRALFMQNCGVQGGG
jgi:hypothetical protein